MRSALNLVAPYISCRNSSTVVCANEKVFSCMSAWRPGEWKDQCAAFVRDHVIVLFLPNIFRLHGFGVPGQGNFLSPKAALLLVSTKNRDLREGPIF